MAIFVSTDDDQVSTQQSNSPDVPGNPPALAGSTGTADGLPELCTFDKPPIANREVDITLPSENRSLLDWVSFTLKLNDPHEAARSIGLDPDLFSTTPFGFSGYRKSLKLGNISIYYEGREDMGCHVEMTGQGCRHYEGYFAEIPWQTLFETVLSVNAKFTRLEVT